MKRHPLNLCTPLHTAARGGHTDVIRYGWGGWINTSYFSCILHVLHSTYYFTMYSTSTRESFYFFCFRYLLSFCHPVTANQGVVATQLYIDINEKNAMQETPLELAACQGHMGVVRWASQQVHV